MNIYAVPGLIATCFLIEQGRRLFLVDTGFLGFERKILNTIRQIGRKPSDLELVVVTHDHIDHFGGLNGVCEQSHALVGCHELDQKGIEEGSRKISPPVNRAGRTLDALARYSLPFFKTRGVKPHLHLHDEMSLEQFGLSGKIIHTPGHTRGHVSVVLEDGSALTGDLVMGKTVVNKKPSLGSFAESLKDVYASWKKILKSGARTIYPAHGNPLSAGELEELIERTNVRQMTK